MIPPPQTGSDDELRPDACWHLDQTSSSQASCLLLWRRADDDLFHIASSFISFIYFLFESFRSSCIAPWLFRVSSSYWCRTKLRHKFLSWFCQAEEQWKVEILPNQFSTIFAFHHPAQPQPEPVWWHYSEKWCSFLSKSRKYFGPTNLTNGIPKKSKCASSIKMCTQETYSQALSLTVSSLLCFRFKKLWHSSCCRCYAILRV